MDMEYFVIYDVMTGKDVTRSSGPPGTAQVQYLGDDRAIITVDPLWYEQKEPIAALPLEAAQAALWGHAKTIRDSLVFAGAMTSRGAVETTPYSITMLSVKRALASSANPDTEMSFTMADNSVVTMFADDLVEMIDEALAWIDSIHEYGRTLRQRIYAAETTLDAIKVDVFRGWPIIVPVAAPVPEEEPSAG
ncbi:MAG: DUF4376 domain-containing protein [Sphingobium sp.]|nr:DUF4376 domain-containing protein [Sphingobium sp.]